MALLVWSIWVIYSVLRLDYRLDSFANDSNYNVDVFFFV